VLLIDAVNEIARERAQSFLKPDNQSRILAAYKAFADESGFTAVVDAAAIERQDWSLSIPLYVARPTNGAAATAGEDDPKSIADAWTQWKRDGEAFRRHMDRVTAMLDGLVANAEADHA